MIKYNREEFPARFTVFEHVCEYCGTKFYSNRAKGRYDTGTCRTYANVKKRALMASGGKIAGKSERIAKAKEKAKEILDNTSPASRNGCVLYIPPTSEGSIIGAREWNNYFPDISWDDVWEEKIKSGRSDRYTFETINDNVHDRLQGKHRGIYIYLRLV